MADEDLESIKSCLSYDPHSGALSWKAMCSNRIRKTAGTITPAGYIRVHLGGKTYAAHRVAWFLTYGQMPSGAIDHIDGDKANNAISNLRAASRSQNGWNRKSRKRRNAGIKGIHSDRGRYWRVIIKTNGIVFDKTFKCFGKAVIENQRKRLEMHGEFANHG